ncbi:hypothetical protein [Deinococcus pimensis]|uniref:hypothetical protein n=1 Tax=Deinococcus pimensis TaxID=309888 RepID=UPI0004805CDC|nr:hypothetical protein [Deinococcus pimensis]
MRRALLLATLLLGLARAQDTGMVVRTLIPDVLTVRTQTDPTTFLIDLNNYPPARFPARYPATARTVSLYATTDRPWNFQIEVHDIVDAAGARLIPASQIWFRVSRGVWIQATGGPQVVYSAVGTTPGWVDLDVEFALELRGGEPGGAYAASVDFTALVLP